MISVKHFMDAAEPADGVRVWVEPTGLTRDLSEWCSVHQLWPAVAPPKKVWQFFQSHPDEWEIFRGQYHDYLAHSPHKPRLQELACELRNGSITLLHQGPTPEHNSAEALREFLQELESYCPRPQ